MAGVRSSGRFLVLVVMAVVVGLVAPSPSAAQVGPTPRRLPYECPADPDLEIQAVLGPGHSVADFVAAWTPRLERTALIDGMTLDEYLDRTGLPGGIAQEGYHALPIELQQCLAALLYDELDAPGGVDDPDFPDPGITRDVGVALIFAFVFDNQWLQDWKASPAPGGSAVINNPIPVDPVDALLSALRNRPLQTVPVVPSPAVIPFVTQTVNQLLSGLLNPVGSLFSDVGRAIESLNLPVKVPGIKLPVVDIGSLINQLRRVVDSALYRVCWTSERVTVRQCSLDLPLGTPVPVDLAGDIRPDVVAQLTPEANLANPANSLRMRWTVTRLPNLVSGYSGPLKAHVFSLFTIPTGDVQLSVGSDGFRSTLANRSDYAFTLTDIQKAIAGDAVIDIRLLHDTPGSSSAVTYGVSPLRRDSNNLGAASTAETFDVGTLNFTPVPAAPAAIDATLTLKTADLDGDGNDDGRVGVDVTMPQAGIVLDATVLSKLPPDGGAECCPFRDIRATVDAVPTNVGVVVDSFPAKRITDVTYDANTSIDRIDFSSTQFVDTDGDYPSGADRNTFSKVTATVLDMPSDVHARFEAPDPDADAKTTVINYDADGGVTQLVLSAEESANNGLTNAAALQRRLVFSADTIPSEIDITNTTTEVSSRQSTGALSYVASGRVTNAQVEVADELNASELVANVASLPAAIEATYDVETPADLVPGVPGCEDPGHTVVHVDGRTGEGADPGTAAFGAMTGRFRSKVSDFLTPDATIAPLEHAILNMDPRSASTCLDDTTQADLRYDGLRSLDAKVLESGETSAVIANDAERKFVFQVRKPTEVLTATITDLPKLTTFKRAPVGTTAGHTKITFDGCTPAVPTCQPKSINSLKVRLDGAGTTGDFKAGEFVDATATTVSPHVDLTLELSDAPASTKKVAFDSSGATAKTDLTAAVQKNVAGFGQLSIGAAVTGIPKHFDVRFGEKQPIVFDAGAGSVIDAIRASITNTGTAQVPATFTPHAYAMLKETAVVAGNQVSVTRTLEATVGLANLASFSLDPTGGGFTGTIKTGTPAAGTNPNSEFVLHADIQTLATKRDAHCRDVKDANGDPVPDPALTKANVIKTGAGGVKLTPLPASIVISKTGGYVPPPLPTPAPPSLDCTTGTDTSALTIDTSGSAQVPRLDADVAIGHPGGVTNALAENLASVSGVLVGDGSAANEEKTSRLRLALAALPTKVVVRYGQITWKRSATPPADPSFDVSGLAAALGSLDVVIRFDDDLEASRLFATIGLKGITPSMGFIRFFPIVMKPHPGGDLDLAVRYQAGAQAGPLNLDFGIGEDPNNAGRFDKRVVVDIFTLPPDVGFVARLNAAAAPDLVWFEATFKDTSGALTASPGRAIVTYQTPTLDGADNPPAKVVLDLRDVPSYLQFVVKTAEKKLSGNPNQTCGIVTSDFMLPTIQYFSAGANRNLMDASVFLDLSFTNPQAPPPPITIDTKDLADGFRITNTAQGSTYNIEHNVGGSTTDRLLVKVGTSTRPLEITILELDWTKCPEPHTMIGWRSTGYGRIGIKAQLRLEIEQLDDVTLIPNLSIGVSGTYGRFTLGLGEPTFTTTFSNCSPPKGGPTPAPSCSTEGFKSGLHLRLSDDVKGTIPVLAVPSGTVSFPLPVVFHVAKQEQGKWFGYRTPIPCLVAPLFLTVDADIEPHRKKLELNQFTISNSETWVATADPLGAATGWQQFFGGVDVIDSIAGLFSSPFAHGIRRPSLGCSAGLPGPT